MRIINIAFWFKRDEIGSEVYLPGTDSTTINKVVGPERGLSIAHRLG